MDVKESAHLPAQRRALLLQAVTRVGMPTTAVTAGVLLVGSATVFVAVLRRRARRSPSSSTAVGEIVTDGFRRELQLDFAAHRTDLAQLVRRELRLARLDEAKLLNA